METKESLRRQFNKKVAKEMCIFRADIIRLDKEKIYEAHSTIEFYENIFEYLTSDYVSFPIEDMKKCLTVENLIEELYTFSKEFEMGGMDYTAISDLFDEYVGTFFDQEEEDE